RVADEVEMELRRRRELERERVAAQIRRMRLAQERRRRDAAALLDRGENRARPGLLELRELDGRSTYRHWDGLRLWGGLGVSCSFRRGRGRSRRRRLGNRHRSLLEP